MSPLAARCFVSAFCFLLALTRPIHAGAAAPPPAESGNPKVVLTNSLTLPARLDEDFFLLEAMIGGEGPFRLLLDTGAEITGITPEVAARLAARGRIESARGAIVRGASGERVWVKGVYFRDLRLGGFCVPRVHAVVTDLSKFSRAFSAPLDGIAGLNLFRDVRLNLDYPAGQVQVEPFDAPLPAAAHRISIPSRHGVPHITIQVAGHRYTVVLDSGASDGFCLPPKRLPLVERAALVNLSVSSLGAQTKSRSARLATNIILGGLTFERPIADVGSGVPLIGSEVLRHFRVDLNQRDGWVCLTPGIEGPVTNKPVRSLGLVLAPHKRGLEVMVVIPGTDAARARIRAGDIVSHLNGEPATQWTRPQRYALVEENDTVEVELVRGKRILKHQIKVAVLVE